GELLACTESNVNFHITNARKKLRAPSRQAAIAIAIQHGKLIL
ncbi:MAG: LuxR C-terminal-related transcriptional regulator, partial [Burkholderiales bacterium]|nr:LuxR C-terminal-related transcriptional regulator [Burkholderiales bacterium]